MNEDHYKKLAEQQRALIEAIGWSQPSIRDQFAMAALSGVNTKEFDPQDIAAKAYEIADAMMEARK
jgi:hypothetical protein